ncbi:type II toxin-antitoxin system MqsA family antitoxin [Paraburkholderia sediminicola]|uniref:type II toxin-antitoxin system MqsA family antitoxin n=1 Tax=Paraburkholderia sediminicola TaxID=458836 RepID=UPI0038BCB7BC
MRKICPVCGEGELEARHDRVYRFSVGRRKHVVEGLEHSVCNRCETSTCSGEQMDRNADKIEAFQAALPHYLSPERIGDLRASFGLSQASAALIFGGGRNSFSKYERGEITPTEGVVTLMKLALAMPQTVVFLAKEKGVALDLDAPIFRLHPSATPVAMPVNMPVDAANEPKSESPILAAHLVQALDAVRVAISGYGKVKNLKHASQDVVLTNIKHGVGKVASRGYSVASASDSRRMQWTASHVTSSSTH